MNLKVQVHSPFLGVAFDFDSLVFFNAIEIIQLVKAKNADFPGALVEELAFIDQQLAANYLVPRGGVSAEIDSPDVILFLLVELQRQVDDLPSLVDIEVGFGSEIDKAILTVDAGVILHRLAQFGDVQDLALLDGKCALKRIHFERERLIRIGTDDFERTHAELRTFFDGNRDVDGLALRPAQHGHRHAQLIAHGIDIFKRGRQDPNAEITVILVRPADSDFQVFVQFVAVVGLMHYVDFGDVERNLIGAIMAHRANEFAVAERMVAGEFDLSDLDLWAFFHFENQNDGVARCDALVLRRNFRKLTAVFAEQFLDDDFGLLDFCGIKLAFNGQTDLTFLEAIENIRFGNGMNIVVANTANDWTFLQFKNNDFCVGAVRRILDAQLHIFKELRVPKCLEVAAQSIFVVRIIFAAENARP